MKFHQIIRAAFLLCTLLGMTVIVQAEDAGPAKEAALAKDAGPAKMLVYISPEEYNNSIKLWHYYYNYWYKQGPAIEPVALQALNAEYGDVKLCQGNELGRSLVWIRPRMYYNPQLEVFYGEVSALIFSGNGKVLGTYKGDSRKHGFLDVYPERQIEAAYKGAMQDLMLKIKKDQALLAKINTSISSNESSSCALVSLLPAAPANDWKHYLESPGY